MKSLIAFIGLIVPFIAFSQTSQSKIDELTARIAKEPSNPALYYGRADAYDRLNNHEQANRDFQKVVNLYLGKPQGQYADEFSQACYRLADEYFFRQANPQKAATYVAEGLRMTPEDKDLQVLDAIITGQDESKHDMAAAKYVILSTKYPDDIRMNLYYGKFLQDTDPLAAAARYEKVLEIDPINEEALLFAGTLYNNQATAISGAGKDPDAGFEYAEKATSYFERLYKMNPENPEYNNILYRLYVELDQNEKAAQLKAPY
jgi:tetratricopeptide (TPR) repeat protein